MIKQVSPESAFRTADGRMLHSLKELAEALILIEPKIFTHHVTKDKNDFADWVRDCLKEEDVEEKLRQAETKDEAFLTVVDAVEAHEKAEEPKIETQNPSIETEQQDDSQENREEFAEQELHEEEAQIEEQTPEAQEQETQIEEAHEPEPITDQESEQESSEESALPPPPPPPEEVLTEHLDQLEFSEHDELHLDNQNEHEQSEQQTEQAPLSEEEVKAQAEELKEQLRLDGVPEEPEDSKEQKPGIFTRIKAHLKKEPHRSEEIIQEITDEEEAEEPLQKIDKGSDLGQLKANIERLQAQHDALNEARKITNQRFMKMAEDQGAMRSNFLNVERQMQEVLVRTAKAVDLVEAIKPQQFDEKIRKHQSQMDVLVAKIEGNKALHEKVMEELGHIQTKMGMFRGVEQILKLNEEVSQKLIAIQKVKVITERHADRIENMFTEVKKQFERFEKFESIGMDLEKSTNNLLAEFEKVKVVADGKASKEDINAIKSDLESSSEVILGQINEVKDALQSAQENVAKTEDVKAIEDQCTALRTRMTEIHQKATASDENKQNVEDRVMELQQGLKTLTTDMKHLRSRLQNTEHFAQHHKVQNENEKTEGLREEFNRRLVDVFKELRQELKTHERQSKQMIEGLTDEVERLSRRLTRQGKIHDQDIDAFVALRSMKPGHASQKHTTHRKTRTQAPEQQEHETLEHLRAELKRLRKSMKGA